MKNVYLVNAVVEDEFTHPPGTSDKAFKNLVQKFLSASTRPVSEFPLHMFSNWFKDVVPLTELMMLNDAPDCEEIWQYKVVIYFPSNVPRTAGDKGRDTWVKKALSEFYHAAFSNTPEDVSAIDSAILVDPTIMVLGRRAPVGAKNLPSFIAGCKDTVVISAITFRNGTGDESGSSLVLWLLVSGDPHSSSAQPCYIDTWRRRGFGRLMLIFVIKHSTFLLLAHKDCSFCNEPLDGVEIYLQVSPRRDEPRQFYAACGFVTINLEETTGLELLPKTIGTSLFDAAGFSFAWIDPDSDEHVILPLLRLSSGCLLNRPVPVVTPAVDASQGAGDKGDVGKMNTTEREFDWCNYPPSKLAVKNSSHGAWTTQDFEEAYSGLNLLNTLLPPPHGHLLRPEQIIGRGCLSSSTRLTHSESGGTTWMNTIELQMMTDLLCKDGRYDASVAIISLHHMQFIEGAFAILQRHLNAKNYEMELMQKKEAELLNIAAHLPDFKVFEADDPEKAAALRKDMVSTKLKEYSETAIGLVVEKYGSTKESIWSAYQKELDVVVKRVVLFYPGLLQKRIIVFPLNLPDHWGGVFVFNAGNINEGLDTPGVCRTCFFRYCSFCPSGDNDWIGNGAGVIWFLNLAFSYQEHQKTGGEGVQPWLNPFGNKFFGVMRGTKQFPALRVLEGCKVLPRQLDSHSCGVGLIAGIAIILRDFIVLDDVNDDGISRYIEIFRRDHMALDVATDVDSRGPLFVHKLNGESICHLPDGTLKPLPLITDPLLNSYDYLHKLKSEWFQLFDHMAEFQNVLLPKRVNPNHVVDPVYGMLKEKLDTFPWPKVPYKPPVRTLQGNPKPVSAILNTDEGTYSIKEPVEDTGVGKNADTVPARIGSPNTVMGSVGSVLDSKLDSKDVASVSKNRPLGDGTEAGAEGVPKEAPEDRASDDYDPNNDPTLPPVTDVWKDGIGSASLTCVRALLPDNYVKKNADGLAPGRYKTFVSEGDLKKFTTSWCTEEHLHQTPEPSRDEEEMERYVEGRFREWRWLSSAEFKKSVEKRREKMVKALNRYSDIRKRQQIKDFAKSQINQMKNQRKTIRKAFQREWAFGNAANVLGLRYNNVEDKFEARIVYTERDEESGPQQREEVITVSREWIRDAKYADGVIQHVINLGNKDGYVSVPSGEESTIVNMDGFVDVSPGQSFMVNSKKIHKLRYIHPHVEWTKDVQSHKRTRGSKGKHLTAVQVPGVWEVLFHGHKKPMKTGNDMVFQFKEGFLDEVKRMRSGGFVDIPVGDFKTSHLDEHPNLLVPGAPRVHFVQNDGEDLCVSKSFSSALYAIGFVDEAVGINNYGETQLRGGTVDAIGKVGEFAKSLLPSWVTRQVLRRRPHRFDWQQLLQEKMKDTIVLGVLNESDGNCSHAVTIHGGYVYDANEEVAIPLCKEALDYCCSTSKVKNEFVNFRKVTLFFYEGKNVNKKVRMKRKIDDPGEGGGGKYIRIVM